MLEFACVVKQHNWSSFLFVCLFILFIFSILAFLVFLSFIKEWVQKYTLKALYKQEFWENKN